MDKAKRVLDALKARGLTLSTAESCTGGLLGAMLTEIPGSSASYRGGVISYCNDLKHRLLGVEQETLDRFGAVSSKTAEAMAEGARKAGRADIGIGITGLAGPDSDGSGLPVGLVFVGYADARETTHLRLTLTGSRSEIRKKAAEEALGLLLEKLK